MKINVLHIINGEFYSGAERVQDLLVQRLPGFGYRPFVGCLKPDRFRLFCQCPQSRVFDFPMASRIDLRQTRRLRTFLRTHRIALLHSHTPRSAMIARVLSLHSALPRVHHFHSPTSGDTENSVRNTVNTVIERLSTIGTKRFIAVSQSVARWAQRIHVPASRIRVVPNGVPPLAHCAAARTRGPCVVGVVALFRPRKGIEVLLEAVRDVVERGTDLQLLAVGEFETDAYAREIRSLAGRLGIDRRIVWRGFQKEVAAELAKMDLFVLPSLYGEGLPMVILEAMSAGLPVIASRVEGIPEVVRHESSGIIVAPGRVAALADAMHRLAGDHRLRRRLGAAARRRHASHFTDTVMAARVAGIYDDLLANR